VCCWYCTISFNSAVPCPRIRWFGRNRFPFPCPPPMWPTTKCGLRNASKIVILENPHSRVYFPTIRGLIVLDHSCTLIEITNLFLLYWHLDLFFPWKFLHLSASIASIACHSRSMAFARSRTTRGSALHRKLLLAQAAELFTLAEIWEMSPVHLRMADVQISSSLSPCPPPGRIERNGTVGLKFWRSHKWRGPPRSSTRAYF